MTPAWVWNGTNRLPVSPRRPREARLDALNEGLSNILLSPLFAYFSLHLTNPRSMNYLQCPERRAGVETSSWLQATLLHRWTQHAGKMQRCWSSPQQGEQISIKFKAERAKSEPAPKLAQHYHMRQSGCLCGRALEQFVMLFTWRNEVLLGCSETQC